MTTTRRPAFAAEDTTIPVAELREGDFLVRFDTQLGIRGANVLSGVKDLEPDYDWIVRGSVRGSRFPVQAVRFRTLSGVTLSLPTAVRVVVRRRLR